MRRIAHIRLVLGFLFPLAFARADNVSLGVVYQGEETVFKLPCANTGRKAIWVVEAVSSCDCLKARFKPLHIDAGETAQLEFAYRSVVAGQFSVEVQLHGSESASVPGTYTVTGFVAPKDWLLPVAQLLGNSACIVPGIEKTGTAFAEVSMGRPGPAHLKSPGRATPVASSRQADADSSLRAVSRGYGFSQNTVVIDTRSPDRFARAHIPRSLNVAAFAIKSRADLRGQLLVLVDEGFAPALLLAETVRLRRAGFAQVVVLDGGLAAWIRQGGATEGAESIPMAVMSLPASDFVRTRPDVEWRVLEIGNRNPGVLPLDFAAEVDRPEDLAKALRDFGASASGRQAPRMLVIAPDQATCARIEARLGTTNPAPIYYLTGGRATFDAYRREQVALVQKPHQLIQIRPDRGRSVAAGGCSTCPKSGGR